MENNHSTHTLYPYSGPIAYMQINLFRRLNGDPYDDNAPPSTPQPDDVDVALSLGVPRFSPIELGWV